MLSAVTRNIGRFFLFIAGGIAVIIVGFFMLRGNMRMWDRPGGDSGSAAAASDGADHNGGHGRNGNGTADSTADGGGSDNDDDNDDDGRTPGG